MKRFDLGRKVVLGAVIFGMGFLLSCKEIQKTEQKEQREMPVSSPKQTETKIPANDNSEAITVNPPHGQPGHTCALPVGAPLDGSVKPQAKTSKSSSTISPLRIDQTPKINPPHGEPGHSCSIPVGAPLK